MITITNYRVVKTHTEFGEYKGMAKRVLLPSMEIMLLHVSKDKYKTIVDFSKDDKFLNYDLLGGPVTLEEVELFVKEWESLSSSEQQHVLSSINLLGLHKDNISFSVVEE